ncbi:cullin-1-like [Vicia villosa]|uniref:cullin-1-like n=1 Tax=Vicia villosa TaxID=3911 RepID=UPI00273CDDFD|nr:cullin-1-like [Vicia villosa]
MSYFEPVFDFEERWSYVQKRIKKLQDNLEGLHDTHLTSEDNIMLYTNIYNMCVAKGGYHVYEKYKKVIHEYISSTVLPSLQEKEDEVLLRELLRRWSNHKTMTIRLSKFFLSLESFYLSGRRNVPSLQQTGFLSFYNLVCHENPLNRQVMEATLAMIDRKLVGETIDETLVKNILEFYLEIGERANKEEPKQFAETMMMKANETYMSKLKIR